MPDLAPPSIDLPAVRRAAKDAREQRDWPRLLEQATMLRETDPAAPTGHVLTVIALRGLRRVPEMRQRLSEALARFPDHPTLRALQDGKTHLAEPSGAPEMTLEALRGAIRDALDSADWPRLAELCAQLTRREPDDAPGYYLGAQAHRSCKRIMFADQISAAGLERFPDTAAMLSERAVVLKLRKQFDAAAACYARLRALLPQDARAYRQGAAILAFGARFAEAESVVEEALTRWPGDVEFLVQSADLAWRRKDIGRARERWERVRAAAPGDRRVKNFYGQLALAEQMDSAVEPASAAPMTGPDVAEARMDWAQADDAAVFKQFEGLGGNCEFGLMQRMAGLEPLGLLRFARIDAAPLIEMLHSDLRGVGEEAHTELFLDHQGEYVLRDSRYFHSHTFVANSGADEAVLLGKLRKRTAFLRDKLLAELRQGNKMFVFRPSDGVVDDATIHRLHAEVRRHGSAALLCVRNAEDGRSGDAVTDWGGGLFVAAMDVAASDRGERHPSGPAPRNYAHWIAVCREALVLHDGQTG